MGLAIDPKDLVVGVADMDENYARTFALWKAAASVDDHRIATALAALTDDLAVLFTREEHLMAAAGDGNLGPHRDEHTRLLRELARFLGHTRAGKSHFARAWIREMFPDWLVLHIRTMDQAAATHILRTNLKTVA